MVGVPGKSKACNTCRKRKIGCDLVRPSCGQCIKAKRHCEGYERETTFLNRTILGWQKRGARKRDAFPKPTYIESAWTEVAANQHSLQSLYDIAQSDVTFGPHTSRLVSTINPCYLIRENLLGAFMQSYLPLADRLIPVDLAASFSWLQAATCLADPGKALSNSLSALALTRIGRKSGDERLTTKGLAFHGQALRELQKALWDPELAMRDETLSAIKTLALYEVYEDTVSVQSWEAHEEGVRQICRLRGPERHENPLAWLLFEDFRYTATIQGIRNRTPLYPQESEWSTIPWRDRRKSPEHRLYDIGYAVATILENADRIGETTDIEKSQACHWQLYRLCQHVHDEMELWNESFLRESSKPLYWRRDAAVNCLETDGFPFASTLEFHSLRAALTTIMFWALQLVLSSTIYHHLLFQLQPSQLEDINKNLGYSREPFYMKYSVSFMVGIAENIAGTVPYLMHPDMGTVACQRLLFPLRVAMSIFQPRPGPELAWFKSVFRKLASEKGIKFGEGIAKSGQTWGVSLSTERHVHEPEAPSHTEGT